MIRSFRARLTFWNAAVIAAVLIFFSAGIVWTNQTRLATDIDRELMDRAVHSPPPRPPRMPGEENGPAPDQSFNPGPPRQDDQQLPPRFNDPIAVRFADLRRPRRFDLQGQPVGFMQDPPFDQQAVDRARQGWSGYTDGTFENQPIRIYTTRGGRNQDNIVQVATDTNRLREIWSAQLWTLAIFLPLAVLGAAAGASFLTRRATKPLVELKEAATSITESDLSRRLTIEGQDEFAELGQTFNAMVGRLEESFERQRSAYTELERAHEIQKRFTADASHELRTPLTRLRLATSSALAEGASDKDRIAALKIADAAAKSMARLVSQMLVLARADAGELRLEEETVDVRVLASEVVQDYRADRIELGAPDHPVTATVDPDQIRRVLSNLIDNAIRHTPGGKSIRLCVEDGPVITVVDEGQGIAAEHLPHLTERFYRADAARGREDGGVGLGLAICKTIMEAHGGTMRIESRIGAGTTVTLRFARRETAESKQNSHTASG